MVFTCLLNTCTPMLGERGSSLRDVCSKDSMCVCVCEEIKKGIITGQNLGAVWCKTRLLNGGGQFDQLCNLIDGAILARALC